MSQEIFWILLSKKLSGEASPSELKDLEILINENPEWQYAIQNLEDLWKHPAPIEKFQAEDAYMLHLQRITETSTSFEERKATTSPIIGITKMRKWYWAAAVILLIATGLLTAGILPITERTNNKTNLAVKELNEISTRQGSKSKIQLPDGSIVWLNVGSKLTYNKEYGQQLREVTLTGEGYFDVIKNKEIPFIIHASNINIKVLGTAFNVKAYPEDKQTETSLIRGSIEVTIKNRPDNKIILSPNEKLIVKTGFSTKKGVDISDAKYQQPPISINKLKPGALDSAVAETQWVENKLVFNDESFAELAVLMERWYNVEIEINDPELLQKRMTGNFEKETIEQAIEALKLTIPFKYELTGNKIIIHR